MTVTSVDIDKQVLEEAKEVFGVKTNKEAIDLALRDAVLRRHQLDAIDALTAIQVDRDPQPARYGEA
ncbi:hypothetical protein GCM10025783_29630 [Amnibacterium soli]|uniref:DUF2191 domain-containing protein n=1 Tax=Amnibacterium soli TaxID=1282736 RepID=A0ABP8ZEZ8_9MICO